jgi:hypothetical protein
LVTGPLNMVFTPRNKDGTAWLLPVLYATFGWVNARRDFLIIPRFSNESMIMYIESEYPAECADWKWMKRMFVGTGTEQWMPFT